MTDDSSQVIFEKGSDVSAIRLSTEQRALFDLIEETNKHLFITGRAGTGKSLLLQYFKKHSQKKFVVVAPTGVAALHVGGQTIHSLFRLPPAFLKKDSLSLDSRTSSILKHIDTVVIDEISMVRSELMNPIAYRLHQPRNNPLPF